MTNITPGERVCHIDNPHRQGTTLKNPRVQDGDLIWAVLWDDGNISYVHETELAIVVDFAGNDPFDAIEHCRYGNAADLRKILTYFYLSGKLANIIYSIGITNVDFYAYQYRPLLNLIDSPATGLLIADEVGLGKTIEAGLIWTELRARYDMRRLLVVCPMSLCEKWRDELYTRFGIDGKIVNAEELLDILKHPKKYSGDGNALIISYTAARPPKIIKQRRGSPRCKLARHLESCVHDDKIFDMVIFDEAHKMRNSNTQTWQLGNLLKEVSEYMILLSATPINLRNQDLFNILRLVDPENFLQESDFERMLEANSSLVSARDIALDVNIPYNNFILRLNEAIAHPMLIKNLQLKSLINQCKSKQNFSDEKERVHVASAIERINLLSYIITRTRKRDVQQKQTFRNVVRVPAKMTDAEKCLYECITNTVTSYAVKNEINKGFLLAMPQRAVSSCPAAYLMSLLGGEDSQEQDFINFYDDDIEYIDDIEHFERKLQTKKNELQKVLYEAVTKTVLPRYKPTAFVTNDSKFNELESNLSAYLNKFPSEKVVVFTTFVATAEYLCKRLKKSNFNSVLITGKTDRAERYNTLNSFRTNKDVRFLISTDVTAEGVDLQFCGTLINYDLPWNPMRIEQRIGRIDRIGQKAQRIHIYNFYFHETIDERIVERLLERLKIYTQALGECEAVIGKEITSLENEIFCRQLTGEEINDAIDRARLAIETRLKLREDLEASAPKLLSIGQKVLEQIEAAGLLSKRVGAHDLQGYVYDYLHSYWDNYTFAKHETDIHQVKIKLPPPLAARLDGYVKEHRLADKTKLNSGSAKTCIFVNEITHLDDIHDKEYISQFHPLIRFITQDIKVRNDHLRNAIALKLSSDGIDIDIEPDIYAFYVKLWSFSGVKDEEVLDTVLASLSSDKIIFGDSAHKVIDAARTGGVDWKDPCQGLDPNLIIKKLYCCDGNSTERFNELKVQNQNENSDRITLQIDAIDRYQTDRLASYEKTLLKHQNEGRTSLAKAMEGKISKLNSRMEIRKESLRAKEKILPSQNLVCLGVIDIL
ncbi:MAG: DEAD/DEAH box helicase family protein [Desulfovibrio sp.]|jgi:superfamily II DNA or RNA helicase|nr:DEAD/DEAH box helicase family protein [Desulfovibrio sp.]